MAKLTQKHIAIVGGGWTGFAAAVRLVKRGHKVSLFESSRTAGGRARRVAVQGLNVDNGQHILLGAYRDSLSMMRTVGIDIDNAFLRVPLQMVYPSGIDGMVFSAPASKLIPAPLHLAIALLRAKGLRNADKLSLARFSSTARWMDWTLYEDCSVTELLQRFDQTPRLCELMWNPLCIAALNTPPQHASAQVFLNVLRDSLGANRAASDMLVPKYNLSALFPEKATAFIQNHGGQVALGAAVTQIQRNPVQPGKWQLALAQSDLSQTNATTYDGIIIATDASNAKRLLQSTPTNTSLPSFEFEAITTCYLQYPDTLRLDRPMFALLEDAAKQHWGQFVFDRGYLHSDQAGLLAVVISAPNESIGRQQEALVQAITGQLAHSLENPALKAPLWHQIITEKRATFRCTPKLQRPSNATSEANLVLAGDYTAGEYPATLEAAVRSGIAAADLLA